MPRTIGNTATEYSVTDAGEDDMQWFRDTLDLILYQYPDSWTLNATMEAQSDDAGLPMMDLNEPTVALERIQEEEDDGPRVDLLRDEDSRLREIALLLASEFPKMRTSREIAAKEAGLDPDDPDDLEQVDDSEMDRASANLSSMALRHDLVVRTKVGQRCYYQLSPAAIQEVRSWS